jgi:dihydrofolate reductase
MRKIILFNMMSLDGYFEGEDADISWHHVDPAFNDFAVDQLRAMDMILFGRKTYQLMASYWPTDAANNDDPVVAEMMNSMPKIVFSKTLDQAVWKNTRLVKDNIEEEVVKLKQQPGKNLIVLGSANLSLTLMNNGLIDEFRVMINPLVLGKGNLLFKGIQKKIKLNLLEAVTFSSGNVLLYYVK